MWYESHNAERDDMRNYLKTLLFLSAFSPSLLSIAVAKYATSGSDASEIYYFIAGLIGIGVGISIMRLLRTYGETLTFSARKIEATDSAMIAVVATYIVPFIGKASDITALTVISLTLILTVVLWVTTALIPHPALRLLRYRFYKVESSSGVVFTVITTRDLNDPKELTRVKKITNSMLVEA